jgi:hypothetical protein
MPLPLDQTSSIATDGRENFGGLVTAPASRLWSWGEDTPAQFRKRGLEPSEIPAVVLTQCQ